MWGGVIWCCWCLFCVAGWNGPAAAQQTAQKATPQPDQSPYQHVLNTLETLHPTNTIEVQMEAEKSEYPTGSVVELRFLANQDCSLTLMRIAPDGTISFPIPTFQAQKGRVYSTVGTAGTTSPDQTMHYLGLNLKTGAIPGQEIFNLVCSPNNLDWLTTDFVSEPAYTIARNNDERLSILLSRLEQLPGMEWSGTSVALQVGPKMRNALPRKNGAIPPILATGTTGKLFSGNKSSGTP